MVYGIEDGMTVRIDKAGRIVLPKPVREHLGLKEGSELELEESSRGVFLRPVGQTPSLVFKDGLLVHTGKPPKGFDWARVAEEEREERIRSLSGL
jgi:AbrB family looped-hinge helix DNA binding protein